MMRYSSCKFTILLASLVLVLSVRLATAGALASQTLLDSVGAVMIIAGMLAACAEKRYRAAALVLAIPATLLTVIGDALPDKFDRATFIATRGLGALALTLVIVLIIRALLTERNVSQDTIAGAFCGYLLIGIVWTELYCLLMLISPDSFGGPVAHSELLQDPVQRWHVLQYFSFATLTAATYGDIVPTSPLARGLALMEVICGQFYLVVLVAGLVGMRVAGRLAVNDPARQTKT